MDSQGSRTKLFFAILFFAVSISGLTTLGVWQLQRRAWKHHLIEQVDQRIHATPVAAPGPEQWPTVDAEHDAYRHVQLQGVYVKDAETLVQSATTLGLGYWVMTPLKTDQGFVALVNRGFIPSAMRDTIMSDRDLSSGEITVTGLLRITEPDGRFMLPNQPSDNRWYSRDVAAIGATHNLSPLAPYFIDVDAENMNSESWPRGGMTVVQFPDSHLMYALTWFGLALMLCGFAAKEFYFSSSKSDKPK